MDSLACTHIHSNKYSISCYFRWKWNGFNVWRSPFPPNRHVRHSLQHLVWSEIRSNILSSKYSTLAGWRIWIKLWLQDLESVRLTLRCLERHTHRDLIHNRDRASLRQLAHSTLLNSPEYECMMMPSAWLEYIPHLRSTWVFKKLHNTKNMKFKEFLCVQGVLSKADKMKERNSKLSSLR